MLSATDSHFVSASKAFIARYISCECSACIDCRCHLIPSHIKHYPALSIGPSGAKFSEILIEIRTFFIEENTFENAVCNWQPFCFGLKGFHCTVYFMRVQCMYRLPMPFNSDACQTLPWISSQGPRRFSLAMVTSSNGNIFHVTGPLCGEFTDHRWIPLTKASDARLCCFLWSAPNNDWVNNREAGDLRRHRAHYDVIVIFFGKRTLLNQLTDIIYASS